MVHNHRTTTTLDSGRIGRGKNFVATNSMGELNKQVAVKNIWDVEKVLPLAAV
jgi:Cdc6-like AAA superfamily ATPase